MPQRQNNTKQTAAAKKAHKTNKPISPKAQMSLMGFRLPIKLLPNHSKLRKMTIGLLVLVIFATSGMYGISQWYIAKHRNDPLKIGVTFIPSYAAYYGLDPKDTMQAMINDLGIRRFRLTSYWNYGEPLHGRYDFTDLDWQFAKVAEAGGKVSLSIGLRQPRWPECHMPDWAKNLPESSWSMELKTYMGAVIARYKNNPVLESYQLENEYFLAVFGQCPPSSRERLVDEFKYVKSQDSTHPVIVTRSNNAVPSWPVGQPRADINGASIYKRVWDRTVTKRYFEYPLPSWYYAFLAGAAEITTGNNTIIHEMQTEAWPPNGILDSTIAEQDKSFKASQMHDRIKYGLDTGMRTVDLWGAEWWYWRKVKLNDPSLWDAARTELQQLDSTHNY